MRKTRKLDKEDFEKAKSKKDLLKIVAEKDVNISTVLDTVNYETEKRLLQAELVKLQKWVKENNKKS